MALRYLLDENLTPALKVQLVRRERDLVVQVVGEVGAPAKGTSDPDILKWCEACEYVLVTQNRKSMPLHLAAHLQAGGHISGIFVVGQEMGMGELIDTLILIAHASLADEFQDCLIYLPLS